MTHSPGFVLATVPRTILRSCETPLQPNVSQSPKPRSPPRRKQGRVGIDADRFQQLKRLSAYKYKTATSTISNIIFSAYLDELERRYFGRARATALTPLDPNRRPYDAILFDMDGVLCDSEHISRETAVEMFRIHYKKAVKTDDFAPFTGTGEARFLEGVAHLYGLTDFDAEDAKRKFFRLYLDGGYVNLLQPFTGVAKLVEGTKLLGLKVAVASSADRVKVDANLKAIGLPAENFDFVTSGDLIERKKPFPDIFLKAAKELDVDPARCIVVEDAVAGVQAAIAAGMRCVAVATSMSADELWKAKAAVVRKDPASLSWEDLFGTDVFADEESAGEESQRAVETEQLTEVVENS